MTDNNNNDDDNDIEKMKTTGTTEDAVVEVKPEKNNDNDDGENKKKKSYVETFTDFFTILLFKTPIGIRVWLYILLGWNMLSIVYIKQVEAIVVFVCMNLSAVPMIFIFYREYGFVRLLGLGHVLMIGMIPYLIYRLVTVVWDAPDDEYPLLYCEWLLVLIILDGISAILDIRDVYLWVMNIDRATPEYAK